MTVAKLDTRLLPVGVLLAAIVGCGGSGGPDGLDIAPAEETGRVSIGVSDAPVHDAEKVCIMFDAIEFKGDGPPETVTLDPAVSVNLLDFQGMNAAPLLVDQELPAGAYQWLRLAVDASRGGIGGLGDTGGADCDGAGSYLAMNGGGMYNLYVPSGEQTGLKLVRGFTVPANGSADFTVEFDLMKSIVAPPGLAPDVLLKPALRLVDNAEAGALSGQVDAALAGAGTCEPAVFLFDDGIMPNPIDDTEPADANDPVATAMVEERMANDGSAEFRYTIGFLLPGDYEAAFTCDGETFEPADGIGVTIAAGVTTTQDF